MTLNFECNTKVEDGCFMQGEERVTEIFAESVDICRFIL